jgi:hypothetical protein
MLNIHRKLKEKKSIRAESITVSFTPEIPIFW